MTIPQPIQITPEQTKKLRRLEDGKKAISQMMQMMQQQAEQRIMQYNQEASKVWEEIKNETGADFKNVLWVPHPTENKIVPVQLNLTDRGFSS